MRIQNNITADNSHRQLGLNQRNISLNAEKLSSGFRVNRAADDAAGLAISEKMRTQVRGLNRASMNIQDGISLLQVGDGALQTVHDLLQRMRELSVQAANDTNELLDREALQLEFGQLTSEINQMVSITSFNNRTLFDGSIGASWEYNLGLKTNLPYTTSIPGVNGFDPDGDGGVTVPGWTTPPGFGVFPSGVPNLDMVPSFPSVGIFAMQIVTPANGTLNVVIDLAETNTVNGVDFAPGTMNLKNITDYFTQEFNNLGLGHVVNNIEYDGIARIVFDFPKNGDTLTGIMGKPPLVHPAPLSSEPRVIVGIGSGNDGFPGVDDGASQRNSLNGIATLWASEPFISNKPGLTITDTTIFANTAIFGSNETQPIPEGALGPAGGFSNFKIDVNGVISEIYIEPGFYPDAQSFIDVNLKAFETAVPRSFDLSIDDLGNIVITTKVHSDTEPSVSLVIHPTSVRDGLGFGSFIPSQATSTQDAGSLIIQSGANEPDITPIMMPRLCTRSLGISIIRPMDDTNPTFDGFSHINVLAADGYRATANVIGDPYMECSLDVTSHEKASAALSVLTNAINIISTERARIGSQQNRLEYAMQNVDNTSENLQASESRIRDVDMAAEMTKFVQNQILTQSSTAMLAQANTLPQGVLQLLG